MPGQDPKLLPPHARNTSGTTIAQRLGYYLAGVAIGLVALGFFMTQKQRAVRAERASETGGAGASEGSGGVEESGRGATPPVRP
jgi:hypothetical protein